MTINLTAQGSGFVVSVDGVETQFLTELEAIEYAVNQKQANPAAVVTYRQAEFVSVEQIVDPAPVPEPVPPPPAPEPLFIDNFNYVADMNDIDVRNAFIANGWNSCKSMPWAPGAKGKLGTVTSIPGFPGNFPSGSPRVLALHALPIDQNGTDFYLQYGGEGATAIPETIPGDVWFQFWIYINRFGDEMSQIDGRNKFLYVCNGNYPCQNAKWMLSIGSSSREPHVRILRPDEGAFLQFAPNTQVATIAHTYATAPENQWKLGQQNVDTYIRMNEWTKVKVHYDTSTASGKVEAWLQRRGSFEIKVAEWIDGVTPGFTWRINPEHIGGHKTLRMPTVFGPSALNYPVNTFMYMDQFVFASSEEALP